MFFFKKYTFSTLFLYIFAVTFSFLKSVESISVLKNAQHLQEYIFFPHFLEVETYNLFDSILIFCTYITNIF